MGAPDVQHPILGEAALNEIQQKVPEGGQSDP